MKKKYLAFFLCLLMVLQITVTPTNATENLYFMGVESNVLPLSDATMPFWQGNFLYIPSSAFSGAGRADAPVRQTVDNGGKWVALHQKGNAILFKEGSTHGEDASGKLYYPGAVKRNGQFYVPVAVVASYFGLKYSVQKVDHGWLVWLRSPDFILSDSEFANAATGMLEHRYQEYASKKAEEKAQAATTVTKPVPEVLSGKKVYLCLEGNDSTGLLLDILDRYSAKATVFCTLEFMQEHHDLLRRMTGTGHGIGILADESLPTPVADQIRAANQVLDQATYSQTRLIRIKNAQSETLEAMEAAGFLTEISQLKTPAETLDTAKGAEALFQKISTSPQASVLWMGDTVQLRGLKPFLEEVKQYKHRCLPLTETTAIH